MRILLKLTLLALLALSPLSHAAGKWVGTPAPGLRMPDQDGKLRTLAEFRGQWVALYFYPRDDTPGCTREAMAFRDRWPELRKARVMVVGASVDGVASHKAFASRLQLPYPLLADTRHELARAMGVLRGIGPLRYASRETFLIDPEGTIVYHYPDVDTARHADEVLADVARLAEAASPAR
ncbi:MAG: peroxiredoxin [Moraxellaceae bacterium]|jgi:peroxiredoxin Q/BCP|nr:peroxiredoxin [Moraxellaceae bacterium]